MNPEDPAKVDNPESESSSLGDSKLNLDPEESESVEELNTIAKALMVKLLWSQVGLLDEKTP